MREIMWHFDGKVWRTIIVENNKSMPLVEYTYKSNINNTEMQTQTQTTQPIAIQSKPQKANNYIGTCRSYDEKQPVPSFVRSLQKDAKQKKTNEVKPRKRLISE